jgi:DNA-binding NtrC family response regulator
MGEVVLLIDDDPNFLDGMRRALRSEPYIVLTCRSGGEALDLLESRKVDLVISDQEMPGMSGTSFLNCVQERHPEITRFMLTGKATLDSAVDAINRGGISRLLLKPCNPIELVLSIRQGLQQHRLMVAAYQLMKRNERQSQLLGRLEKLYPNITKVERDSDGAIRIEDFHGDINLLLEEINTCLKEC